MARLDLFARARERVAVNEHDRVGHRGFPVYEADQKTSFTTMPYDTAAQFPVLRVR
jgi:hypothetical protein